MMVLEHRFQFLKSCASRGVIEWIGCRLKHLNRYRARAPEDAEKTTDLNRHNQTGSRPKAVHLRGWTELADQPANGVCGSPLVRGRSSARLICSGLRLGWR